MASVGAWRRMDWARILAYVTGMVDQELLTRNEYLAAENRILKAQLKGRLQLSNAERATLGEIGHRLGGKALAEVASVARPDTILAWYRKLIARKFDGLRHVERARAHRRRSDDGRRGRHPRPRPADDARRRIRAHHDAIAFAHDQRLLEAKLHDRRRAARELVGLQQHDAAEHFASTVVHAHALAILERSSAEAPAVTRASRMRVAAKRPGVASMSPRATSSSLTPCSAIASRSPAAPWSRLAPKLSKSRTRTLRFAGR